MFTIIIICHDLEGALFLKKFKKIQKFQMFPAESAATSAVEPAKHRIRVAVGILMS